jgi:hypothetical protein
MPFLTVILLSLELPCGFSRLRAERSDAFRGRVLVLHETLSGRGRALPSDLAWAVEFGKFAPGSDSPVSG